MYMLQIYIYIYIVQLRDRNHLQYFGNRIVYVLFLELIDTYMLSNNIR